MKTKAELFVSRTEMPNGMVISTIENDDGLFETVLFSSRSLVDAAPLGTRITKTRQDAIIEHLAAIYAVLESINNEAVPAQLKRYDA